jgi:ATP-dependent helicase/nuclease subunit A
LPPSERAAAARGFAALPGHALDALEQAEICAEVLAVLDDPGLADLWGPNSRAEVPIVGLIGEQALSGQIDRLVVADARVLIVDFKTVRPAPASEQQVPAVYLQQLATYRAALRRIYPDHEVDGAFLWTDGPVLMPIAAALLDRHLPSRLAPRRSAG